MSDRNLPAPAPGERLAVLQPILATVPTVEEDPTPRMMAVILEAADPGEWEDLFRAQSFKELAGRRVRVNTIRWAPSNFEGSTGVYLVADVTFLDGDRQGEKGVVTISSDIAMAQLLNAWARQDYPYDYEIVQKSEPTRRGFKPMRLRPLGRPVVDASANADQEG
jgi:hypothetical protein